MLLFLLFTPVPLLPHFHWLVIQPPRSKALPEQAPPFLQRDFFCCHLLGQQHPAGPPRAPCSKDPFLLKPSIALTSACSLTSQRESVKTWLLSLQTAPEFGFPIHPIAQQLFLSARTLWNSVIMTSPLLGFSIPQLNTKVMV